MKVGFIGLGDMGAPMAVRIALGGHQLHTWSRHPMSLRSLEGVTFRSHESPADLAANVEHLAVCVGSQDDVHEVLVRSGAAESLPHGSIVAVHSTIAPAAAVQFADHVRQWGHGFVDAPVSGARTGAERGQLLVLAGGTQEDLRRAQPVMTTYAGVVFHVGDVGAGQRWKILNNLAMNINITTAHLVLDLGGRLGIDRAELRRAMLLGSGASRGLEALDALIQPGRWSAANGRKDLQLARELLAQTREDDLLSRLISVALEVREALASGGPTGGST